MAKINKNIENGTISVSFELNKDTFAPFLKNAKEKLINNVEVKGFRKGKVPAEIAEKHVSEAKVLQTAMNAAIDANYDEIFGKLTEEKIASRPELELKELTEEILSVVFSAALMPEVKLGDISKIDVKMEVKDLTEEEKQQQLEGIKGMFKKQVEQTEGSIKEGDVANIDFLGKLDGKPFDGGEAKGFDLKIGSKSFIDNFEDQLIGKSIGQEVEVEVTFPEEYQAKELAGKKANFEVKINSVKVETTLEGEELQERLKGMGFDSMEALEEQVIKMSKEQKEQQSKDVFFGKFVEAVKELEDTELTVPEAVILPEIEAEFNRFGQKLAQQGMNMKQYLEMLGTSEEDFKQKNIKVAAEKRVLDGIIFSALLDKFEIKVDDSAIEAEQAKIAEAQNVDIEQVKQQVPAERIASALQYEELIKKINK